MGNQEFENKAVTLVAEETGLEESQIYVVWLVKVLQNNKALLSTSVSGDGLYFEVTYNGDKAETYVDEYHKVSNKAIKD